ncbi:MAG: hypothetical protein HRU21_11720 [Pseudomonadales bacterium]|nr:hypothetical protein [Pseudomonadales bacterium]
MTNKKEQVLYALNRLKFISNFLKSTEPVSSEESQRFSMVLTQLETLLLKEQFNSVILTILIEQLEELKNYRQQQQDLNSVHDSILQHHDAICDLILDEQDELISFDQLSLIGHQHSHSAALQFLLLPEQVSNSDAENIVRSLYMGDKVSLLIENKVVNFEFAYHKQNRSYLFEAESGALLIRSLTDLQKDFASGFAIKPQASVSIMQARKNLLAKLKQLQSLA